MSLKSWLLQPAHPSTTTSFFTCCPRTCHVHFVLRGCCVCREPCYFPLSTWIIHSFFQEVTPVLHHQEILPDFLNSIKYSNTVLKQFWTKSYHRPVHCNYLIFFNLIKPQNYHPSLRQGMWLVQFYIPGTQQSAQKLIWC